uniref:CCHC-type domain-containing protein n=1 Tax=Zea mays TaxID=4577 RepID=A0A804PA02_MAIZE
MDSRGAAALLPPYPPSLLSLLDLDRSPAVMEMCELEAVTAALPAKKRRLRETFDRLVACSPRPLPLRWEDLDTYISSFQYSATLRHHRDHEKSMPAPALAPAPAAMSLLPVTGGDVGQVRVLETPRPAPAPIMPAVLSSPVTDDGGIHNPAQALGPAPAAMSLLPVTVGDVGQEVRVLEKTCPAPAHIMPAVSSPPATDDGDVHHKLRTLVTFEPAPPKSRAPAPAAVVSAPIATGVHVEEGRKRKAFTQEAEEVHMATPTTQTQEEGQAEMRSRKIQEDAAVKKETSPSHDSNRKVLVPVPPGDDDNGLAAEANARTDATDQVDPVSKVAIVQPELPEPVPATARRDATSATNLVRVAGVPNSISLLRSRPRRLIPASDAAASAAAVTGRDLEKSKKRKKVPSQEVEAASQKVQMQHAVQEVVQHDSVVAKNIPSHDGGEDKVSLRRPAPGSGSGLPITAVTTATAEVDADPIPIFKASGIRHEHESPATMPHASYASSQGEGPDVEMEIAQLEEMPQVLIKEDASMAAMNAYQIQVIKSEQDGKASAPAPTSAGGVPAATRDDATASHATRRAPLAAGSQQDASDVSPFPPCGGNGLAQSSPVRAGAVAQTVSARHSAAVVRQGFPATATNLVPASSRRKDTGPLETNASPNVGKHVLQQQHMPEREPTSSPEEQQEWSSKNHGGRPTDNSQPVPEAQDAATQRSWTSPGEGRDGGLAARGLPGDDDNRNKGSFNHKGKRRLFCLKCGCKGHLAGNCRTAKHLVALYQKAMMQQKCFRCGCTGHWSRTCRTEKHLVDLYQIDRAAKCAAGHLHE